MVDKRLPSFSNNNKVEDCFHAENVVTTEIDQVCLSM